MAGTIEGGRKAAQKNLANDPNFYRRIGAIGGKNGHTGGFAAYVECECARIFGTHHKAMCAGKKGGHISRRTKKDVAYAR